jgi:uncharacterized protein (DUF58 family)
MKPRVRIRPNRNCVGLIAVLIAMIYAGASQTNGAAYLLAFTLASLASVSFSHAWANIRGLTILIEPVRPVFAGETLRVRLGLAADGSRTRCGLRIAPVTRVDQLPPGTRRWLDVDLPAEDRGRFETLAIEIRSLYPLGFFTASARFLLPAIHFIYPEPEGDMPLPVRHSSPRPSEISPGFEGEDFAGVRAYRTGESQRHIDWKAVARGQPMLIKQWAGDPDSPLVLDYYAVLSVDPETRLRQLARWILLADRTGAAYGLHLPGFPITPASGEGQRHTCLRALAEFEL